MRKRNALAALFAAALLADAGSARAAGMTTVPATAASPAVPIYVVSPRGNGPFPAVLFLHGCEGFNAFDALAADRLAARGYVAAAIDSIGPDTPGGACTNRDGATTEANDARAALAWLAKRQDVDPKRLGVVGFSMGGNAILQLIDPTTGAANVPAGLRVAVAFYPYCADHPANVAAPLAIFDGDADTVTPAPACQTLAKGATAAGKTVEITTYPGATHAFNVDAPPRDFYGAKVEFDPSATLDSAMRTLAFLNRYLSPSP